jgi:hypothetical protein
MVRRLSLALCACSLALLAVACGDDDGGTSNPIPGTDVTPTAYVNDPTAAPILEMPASRYSISQPDLVPGYLTDVPGTYDLTIQNYSTTRTFTSPEEGVQKMSGWGYLGGYETAYTPEGRERALLNGAYTIYIESHLFESEAGAQAAFDYFRDRLAQSVSEEVTAPAVGNQWSAWRLVSDPISDSSVNSVFHRLLFRRGNLLVIVATYGAEPLMEVDRAFDLAVIVDEKALGNRSAVAPTPTGGG